MTVGELIEMLIKYPDSKEVKFYIPRMGSFPDLPLETVWLEREDDIVYLVNQEGKGK